MSEQVQPISTVRAFAENISTTPTDSWFLNELLTNPRFWRVVRAFVGLNQTQFGRELGVSRNAVSSWETETCIPSRKHIVRAQVVLERHLRKTMATMKEQLEGEFLAAAIDTENKGEKRE